MRQIVFLAILILAFCFAVSAQSGESVCPPIEFVEPNGVIIPEKPASFAVEVGGAQKTGGFVYEWTFSTGAIVSGQGTASVEFIVGAESAGFNLTASVKVGGLPKNCSDTYSDVFAVASLPAAEPLAVFGKIAADDYKARLDGLMIAIANAPHSKGLICLDFAENSRDRYKISLLRKIRKHFILRKFDLTDIAFAVGGKNSEERTIFWVVPASGQFPRYVYQKEHYRIVKAEDLESKLKELFPKK